MHRNSHQPRRRRNARNNTSRRITSRTSLPNALRIIDRTVHTICQCNNYNTTFIANTGFGGSAYDIVFGITQQGVIQQQANGAWAQANGTFSNYASLAAVFQEYRIIRFECDIYYSDNSGPTNAGVTGGALPMFYALVDREDARSVTNVTGALQYASCRVMQMGNSSGPANGRQTIVCDQPSCFGLNDNDASLIGTATASQLQFSPWLSLGTNTSGSVAAIIPHGYIKFMSDPVGCTNVTANGTVTFIFRSLFEFRGID